MTDRTIIIDAKPDASDYEVYDITDLADPVLVSKGQYTILNRDINDLLVAAVSIDSSGDLTSNDRDSFLLIRPNGRVTFTHPEFDDTSGSHIAVARVGDDRSRIHFIISENVVEGGGGGGGSASGVIVGGALDGSGTAVDPFDVKTGGIDRNRIADDAVHTDQIATGAITNDQLRNGSVETANIQADAVTNSKIADDAVDTAQIANDAVTESKINNNAVGTNQIEADAVTNAKIANSAVDTDQLADRAVETGKIDNDAITQSKIADNAVGTDQIADNAVDTDQIANGAVDTSQIASSAVTSGKISSGSVTTAKIANDAITNAKVVDDAIDTDQIADSAVETAQINDDAVTLAKMSSGTAGKVVGYDSDGDPTELNRSGELEYFDTTEYDLDTTNHDLTITHNLGVAPKQIDLIMVCATAENGWSVGDQIFHGVASHDNFFGSTQLARILWHTPTTTTVKVIGSFTKSTATTFLSLNKSTGVGVSSTVANWKMRIKVIA